MEKARLSVKNFGPLKDIDIEVREMVCLIGKQATGKSTLAKLLAILEDEKFRKNDNASFEEELKNYGMFSFLNNETYICYSKDDYKILYIKNEFIKTNLREDLKNKIIKVQYNDTISRVKKLNLIKELFVNDLLKGVGHNNVNYRFLFDNKDMDKICGKVLDSENVNEFFKLHEDFLTQIKIYIKFDSQYIPSERNFLHLISENTLGLINNNVQIPKHLLEIGQEYEKALSTIKELPLKLIDKNLKYKREGKTSYIYHNQDDKVDLLQSASGLQSIIPILLLVEYAQTLKDTYNFNFVVEEPELNIYPETQHELIKYLVKNCLDKSDEIQQKNLIITTHSPYVLASINNLLLAYDKGQTKEKEVCKIIKKESWLNPEKFIAYQLKNGKATKIMDDKLGQIKSNMIDDASDAFSYEFDKLLDL